MRKAQPRIEYRDQPVRIIRSTADGAADYFLPRHRAEALHAEGKLCQIMVYANRWDYAHTTDNRFAGKLT